MKWLDLVALAEYLLPEFEINRLRYFTARINPDVSPLTNANTRQQAYLRALATLPQVSIHFGHFRSDVRHMPAVPAHVDIKTRDFVRHKVRKIEEKGTDVSLGVHMIYDAALNDADIYVMLSNDSDQVETLNLLKRMGKKTGLILPMPDQKRGSKELKKTNPDIIAGVHGEALFVSQFPNFLSDKNGTIYRPKQWR